MPLFINVITFYDSKGLYSQAVFTCHEDLTCVVQAGKLDTLDPSLVDKLDLVLRSMGIEFDPLRDNATMYVASFEQPTIEHFNF